MSIPTIGQDYFRATLSEDVLALTFFKEVEPIVNDRKEATALLSEWIRYWERRVKSADSEHSKDTADRLKASLRQEAKAIDEFWAESKKTNR